MPDRRSQDEKGKTMVIEDTSDRKRMGRAIASVLALGLAVTLADAAAAASTCSDCHGMPPIDAAYRNITTGGFKGSHQTHQPATAAAAACAVCHTGSGAYAMDHMNGTIEMATNLNASPQAAVYSKGVFFNQTSNPVMGTCSNVNCHFEKVTPVWSSGPLTVPAGCSSCHGLPPADGSHPSATAGSGKRHGDYYGTGTASCVKCHPDHSVAAKPFAHASSAGNRGLILRFTAAPNTAGTYSKTANLNYPNYLPSQTTAANRNGSCTAMYCHSDGNGGAAKTTAVWGGTLPADCSGCHGGNASSAGPIATGLHAQHVNAAAVLGTNYACAVCHNGVVGTANDRLVTTLSGHVNGTRTVSFSGGGTWNATARTCASTVCHASGKATAPQPPAPAWTGAAMGCNGCHGTSNPLGTPDYANGGSAAALANSHAKHVAAAADCALCHVNTTTTGTAIKAGATVHTNGVIDVNLNTANARVGGTATWTAGSKTCANVYCHGATLTGGTAKSPVWGATLTGCGTCHGFPPATSVHTGKVATDCIGCHPHVNASGTGFTDAAKHINGAMDASGGHAVPYYTHLTPAPTTAQCSGCHANASATAPYPAGSAPNYTAPDCRSCHVVKSPYGVSDCSSCHGTAGATGVNRGRPTGSTFPNIAGQHGKGDHRVACSSCHGTYGTGRTDGTHGPGNRAPSTVSTRATKVNVTLPTWNPTTRTCGNVCSYNHGSKTWY
ncbi:CxxxxCH/CxxCH domain c-type cytochrome [Geobacter sulfurreducens]|uniref:CxxxxCH/CxxCH domain c-type cytochrome n=1 Tax=Geobacter sulfurreducens TaxID=35554 RepID=UPI002B81D4AC|nr:CxxxxCH/CxxCH domain-containing protein [Geobacter sulfurreducens]HML76718.1 CxxxxCH/CxxCH domain-containing protein [Geobacter sulfurreducens]